MSGHLSWHLARASGLVAWALVSASVVWGLLVSTRSWAKRPGRGWVLDLHRFLGALGVVFTGIHVAALVADSYVHFGPADVLLPFASGWRPAAVAAGVVAAYLLVAIEVTSLLQRRLRRRVWRAVHLLSFPLWFLATAHLLAAGADAGAPAVRYANVATAATVLGLVVFRLALPRRRAAPRAERPARTEPLAPGPPAAAGRRSTA